MNKIMIKNNVKKIFCYIAFLFAFLCIGFVSDNIKVEAKHVLEILDGIDINNEVTFTYFYDGAVDEVIDYSFTYGIDTTVKGTKRFDDDIEMIKENGGVKRKYKVGIPEDIYAPDSSYGENRVRKFSMEIHVESWWLFISSSDTATKDDFEYSADAPKINSVTVSTDTTKSKLAIGDVVKFTINFDSEVFISDGLKVSFKVGETVKTSNSCDTSTDNTKESVLCEYKVTKGDFGEISDVRIKNYNKAIKGVYSNYIEDKEISATLSGSIDIDGIAPYIKKISVEDGSYSSVKPIPVSIVFSETIVVDKKSYNVPVLTVSFQRRENEKITSVETECEYVSGQGDSLSYSCNVDGAWFGLMTFESVSGQVNGLSDEVGNKITLVDQNGNTLSKKTYDGVEVNNKGVNLTTTINTSECSSGGSGYCKTGDTIEINFEFDMDGSYNDKKTGVDIFFGGKEAKGTKTISYPNSNKNKKLTVRYIISQEDDGILSVGYSIHYIAKNGVEKYAKGEFPGEKQDKIYVDNGSPILDSENIEVWANDEVVDDGDPIYSAKGSEVTFVMNISDTSSLSFDDSKVKVIVHNQENSKTCDKTNIMQCEFESITFDFNDGVLKIILKVGKEEISRDVQIQIDKEAIKDLFGNTLSETIVTGRYTLDTKYPVFTINVSYPKYKGYEGNDSWFLISGDTISFNIGSNDGDLRDYCISKDDYCDNYVEFESNTEYTHSFSEVEEGENTFIIKVRDKAGNVSEKIATFVLKNIFGYSNGIGSVAKNHTITVDVSLFEVGTQFKYAWFKEGSAVTFSSANITSKQEDDVISIDGLNEYNGNYMLCIYRVVDEVSLCSEYVEFDNRIDKFEVNISDSWAKESLVPNIVFNDVNIIKCLAVGKNYSGVNCDGNHEDVVVYRTGQAISPFNKHVISENGVYYFYIEDFVGNSRVVSKQIVNIDSDKVVIDVFNGEEGEKYSSNLELGVYKKEHSFLAVFDKDINSSSSHLYYKYFYSTVDYEINDNIDKFNAYYLKSSYKAENLNPKSNKWYINTPNASNTYYLYIMASDKAGNVSFALVKDIKVDVLGPSVKAYNKSGVLTSSVGSVNFISSFEYSFVIEDYDSKLDLNKVYYNWIDSSNVNVFANNKQYSLCSSSDYTTCRIDGGNVEFGKGLFDPKDSYKFVLVIYDNAGNESKFTSSSFKIDTTSPFITTSINEDKWYNTNNFEVVVSKENNVGTLTGIAYCVNECLSEGKYDIAKFSSLSVVNPTKEVKNLSLDLSEGSNTLYLYAIDAFGNYAYKEYIINYDKKAPVVVLDEEIDLSGSEEKLIEFTINDLYSGVSKYCVYIRDDNKDCHSLDGEKNSNVGYVVDISGVYYIEVIDLADNKEIYRVNVIGVDKEPIMFDLESSVKEGKFTNGNVTISLVNMRDSTSNDVRDDVRTIDYVKLPYDSIVGDYDEVFSSNNVINVYTKGEGELKVSFSVSSNDLYLVRVNDLANNVSYRKISVNNIDKDNPIVDTNTYSNGKDRIYLYGQNGKVNKDVLPGHYTYSKDTLMLYVGEDSLKDKYNNFNGLLTLNVCFKGEDEICAYESYSVITKLNENKDYIINRSFEITAPYDFVGEIYYYVSDGAGNSSEAKSFVVNYVLSEDEPVISYASKSNGSYSHYKIVYNEAYVTGSVKLKFEDTDLDYFEVYTNNVLESKCYVTSVINDINCIKNGEGEIGFVIEKGNVYYYLNSGNHIVKAYDMNSNVKEVNVYTDSGKPDIDVYKKVNSSYVLQTIENGAVFNSLNDLYIKVNEETFSYVNIDLYNSKTGDSALSASRYSYVNTLGKCLYDSSVCEYGASINDLLVMSTNGYNQIIVTVYDKASNYSSIVISYDVETPEIILVSEGEKVYVNGIVYSVEENNTIKVQIGANNRLTLDNLLSEVVKDVDGYRYNQVKDSSLFKVKVYKNSNLYSGDIFDSIGLYEIELSYVDDAGNVAVSKYINIEVEDKVKPILTILDVSDKVEIKEIATMNGIRAIDNYGLEMSEGNLVTEKVYGLNNSICSLISNSGSVSCLGKYENVALNKYKFIVAGTYTFTYTVTDLAGNTVQIVQTLYVNDNKGPVMVADNEVIVVKVGNRNHNQSINIDKVSVNYPTSYDDGDELNHDVEFVGLFSVNNMKEKYKIINDTYLVSDINQVLTYKFTKTGVYYLRFSSSDKSGNMSIFEYEIHVVDDMAPSISGVNDKQVIEVEIGDKFDLEQLINDYSVTARDNYDENVGVSYDINTGVEHTYEIVFTSSDSSNNSVSIVVYVDIIDTVIPVVGELIIVESTILNELTFDIVGGEDNSNKFYHEYSVQNGPWNKYDENSVIVFGNDLDAVVKVCIRAVDYSANISADTQCKDIMVDTKKPVISGVKEGEIYNKEVTINVTDNKLDIVEITLNGELLELNKDDLPVTFNKVGKYGVIARDLFGNEVSVNFIINVDAYMEVVNDVNADEYTTTSIDFDKRLLVKADVEYNNNGETKIDINLDHVTLNEKDMIYVLGVVPNTSSTFVMFSASSDNIVNYDEGVTLLSYGNSFKEGVSNEDCLVKINDDYYVYLIVKENIDNSPVIVEKDDSQEEGESALNVIFIVLGSLVTLLIGYQIFKFRKRVRAA